MSGKNEDNKKQTAKKGWLFPASIAIAGIGSAATLLMRGVGCHHNWSWPMRVRDEDVKHAGDEGYSYQVCTKCGIRRLYDEKILRAFGPAGYDLHELIAHDRAAHIRWLQKQERKQEKLDKRTAGVPHVKGA